MKYYKLNYDANRPSVKQVLVPDNSDFGVAVKMYKNGVPTSGLVTIGDLSGEAGPDGYSLVELSCGGTGMYSLGIDVETKDAEGFVGSGTNSVGPYTILNTRSKNISPAVRLNTLEGFPDRISILASQVTITGSYTLSAGDSVETTDISTSDITIFADAQHQYSIDDGKWKSKLDGSYYDSIEVVKSTNPSIFFYKTVNNTTGTDGKISGVIDVDFNIPDEISNNKFNLQVCVTDKGYIEKAD